MQVGGHVGARARLSNQIRTMRTDGQRDTIYTFAVLVYNDDRIVRI